MNAEEARDKLRTQISSFLSEEEELDTVVAHLLTQFPDAAALEAYQELSDKMSALLMSYADALDGGRWPTL